MILLVSCMTVTEWKKKKKTGAIHFVLRISTTDLDCACNKYIRPRLQAGISSTSSQKYVQESLQVVLLLIQYKITLFGNCIY